MYDDDFDLPAVTIAQDEEMTKPYGDRAARPDAFFAEVEGEDHVRLYIATSGTSYDLTWIAADGRRYGGCSACFPQSTVGGIRRDLARAIGRSRSFA